jgi:hypothetical protein
MRSERGYITLAFMTLDGTIANSVPTRATGVNTERFIRDVEIDASSYPSPGFHRHLG